MTTARTGTMSPPEPARAIGAPGGDGTRVLRRGAIVTVFGLAGVMLPAIDAAPPQQPTFRAGVDVVQLDVTVLDRDRSPVRGLTAADFTILEDGQSRPIVSVESVDLTAPTDAPIEGPAVVVPDVVSNQSDAQRLVVIVFDDANAGHAARVGRDPWIMQSGKQIAREVVDRLGPNDLAAVAFTYMGRAQNFTSDRARLLAAIDSFVPQGGSVAGSPLACSFRGQEGNCVLDTLRHVAEALPSSPPRRKVLVFISQGDRLPFLSTDDDGELSLPSSDRLLQIGHLQRILRSLQQTNVAIYAYSPGGLQIHGVSPGNEALRGLAEHTGGRAAVSTNTPWETVPAMFDETGSYYLIGFETTHTDGRFHAVDVRVNRPDVTVRTRAGYFAPARTADAEGESGDDVAPIERALSGGLPVATLPLSTIATAHAVAGERDAEVTVLTRVDAPAAGADGPTTRVELLTVALDTNWRERDADRRTVEITRPPGVAPDAPAEIVSTLRLRPGRYELRVAAEGDGLAGSVYVDLEVPDFDREPLSLAGPAVMAGTGIDGGTPTTRRTFGRTEIVTVHTDVWQGGRRQPDSIGLTARIVDLGDREVWQQQTTLPPAAFDDGRAVSHAVRLPLEQLAPGTYVLAVDATRSDRTLTRHVRFTVR